LKTCRPRDQGTEKCIYRKGEDPPIFWKKKNEIQKTGEYSERYGLYRKEEFNIPGEYVK